MYTISCTLHMEGRQEVTRRKGVSKTKTRRLGKEERKGVQEETKEVIWRHNKWVRRRGSITG